MSKKEKVVVNYVDAQILADLEFTDLIKKYRERHLKEKECEAAAADWKLKKKPIGDEIQIAIETVKADSVVYDARGGKQWRATLVKGETGTKTDEDMLKLNLVKMAKLDVVLLEKIWTASQVPVAAKKPYVLVTVQDAQSA